VSAHVQAQLVRTVRLLAFVMTADPVAAALVQSSLARYPLAAALVAAAEVVVRQVFPVKPLPKVSSVPASPPSAPPGPSS
jgi:hypothetical protein